MTKEDLNSVLLLGEFLQVKGLTRDPFNKSSLQNVSKLETKGTYESELALLDFEEGEYLSSNGQLKMERNGDKKTDSFVYRGYQRRVSF